VVLSPKSIDLKNREVYRRVEERIVIATYRRFATRAFQRYTTPIGPKYTASRLRSDTGVTLLQGLAPPSMAQGARWMDVEVRVERAGSKVWVSCFPCATPG